MIFHVTEPGCAIAIRKEILGGIIEIVHPLSSSTPKAMLLAARAHGVRGVIVTNVYISALFPDGKQATRFPPGELALVTPWHRYHQSYRVSLSPSPLFFKLNSLTMIILQNPHLAKHVCHASGHWFDWAPSRLSDLIGPQGIPLNSGLGMGSGSADGRVYFSFSHVIIVAGRGVSGVQLWQGVIYTCSSYQSQALDALHKFSAPRFGLEPAR